MRGSSKLVSITVVLAIAAAVPFCPMAHLALCFVVLCITLAAVTSSCRDPPSQLCFPSARTNTPAAVPSCATLCCAVQELDLGDADTDIVTVDDLSMCQLSGLAPTLKRLSLARCRWVSSCEPLKELARLEFLDLSGTDVGPKALEALAQLPALRDLNLTGCRSVRWPRSYCTASKAPILRTGCF